MAVQPFAGRVPYLLAEASPIPASARIVLFCLIGLLLVILGFLIAFAVVIRRRPPLAPPARAGSGRGEIAREPAEQDMAGIGEGGEVLAVTEGGAVACPTCRREYDGGVQFCPHDSRRLVPAAEMIERARSGGSICPRCRRAFDPGVRFCPHDASDLVPVTVYEATRGEPAPHAPTGVIAKICPQCRHRYDLVATFCGRDGSELVVIN